MTTAPEAATVRTRARAFTLAAVLLLAGFVFLLLPRLRFETNLLALLPPAASDAVEDAALERFSDQVGRNAVWLVGAADFDHARGAAQRFATQLEQSKAFAEVHLQIDAGWPEQAAAALAPYRGALLPDAVRTQLATDDREALLDAARQSLYSPAAFLRRAGVQDDPMGWFGAFLNAATPSSGALTLHDGVLADEADGQQWVMVRAVLKSNPFGSEAQAQAGAAIDTARAAAQREGARVVGSGLIQHAVAASRLARHEIDLFGGLQLAGLIALLLWVFRSWRLLAVSAAVLVLALVAALTVSAQVFGAIHVLTLVFCSNLAGIAIDYAIYFAADQFRAPGRWQPRDALRGTGGAITMSMLAAVLSYALLAVAPFPGLRQIALFCCVGLAMAWLGVMAWFPVTLRPAPAAFAQTLSNRFAGLLARRARLAPTPKRVAALLLAGLAVVGITRVQFADSVGSLQPAIGDLVEQERQVRGLLGSIADSRFFLVRGATPESVLCTEEALRARLDAALHGPQPSPLAGYGAVSAALPSQARQRENRELLRAHALGADGVIAAFLREVGFAPAAVASRLDALRAEPPPLTPDIFLQTPAADAVRHLWLGDIGRGVDGAPVYASVVSLVEVGDAAATAHLADGLANVRFIDRIAETSAVLKHYRERALLIVALAAIGSALLLGIGYGLRTGFLLMSTPVAACLATLGLLGLLGVPVTFFHVVALHLVTGLSMEYAILLRVRRVVTPATLLAAALAAALALLAFGLLALSATPFIQGLGLTTAIGVVLGFILAFAAGTIGASPASPALVDRPE